MLPYKYKIPGYIMVSAGFILVILFFSVNFRFQIPVFAIVSSYMETRFLTTFKTNFADETILFLLLAGFILVVFSREKTEYEFIQSIRFKAAVKAALINSLLLVFSILFIYGSIFKAIVILCIFLPFILYLIFFNYYLAGEKRRNKRGFPAESDYKL